MDQNAYDDQAEGQAETDLLPEPLAGADLSLAAQEPAAHLDTLALLPPAGPPPIQLMAFSSDSPDPQGQQFGEDSVRARRWLISGGDTTTWRGLDSVSFLHRLDSLYLYGKDTTGMRWVRYIILDSLAFRHRVDSLARAGKDTAGMRWITPDSLWFYSARGDSSRARGYKVTDTTYVVCLDSTARLEQFKYERADSAQVSIFPKRTYPLFGLNHSNLYRREAVLDSSGNNISFKETVGGADVKVPVSMSLKDYIRERQKVELHKMFADEARKPAQAMERNDLGELLSNITKIQIPIPPNPIFSIFGKPVINLNINGSVDIKAGFRNTKSDQTTISYLDQSRNEPDFSQEVQVGVNGTIGDKLNILADWNTQRTFEYENQLKIKYTGYEDEIVQSVEAGNVSLQTPSSFIGSSQALFGVKAKFQAGPLTLTTLASQKKGQIKEVGVSGGAKEQAFEMRAWEYATNHYFVDYGIYHGYYEPYYANDPVEITPSMQETQIVEEEVWVSRQGSIPDVNERSAIADINLDVRPTSGYNPADSNKAELPGQVEVGPFIKLDNTQYELDGDGYLGEISLNANVGDQQIIAIAYRTAGGKQYGEFARDKGSRDEKLILKMVKPKNLISNGPSYVKAWNNLLKNIYPIQGVGRNLKKNGFTLDIVRRVPGGEDQNSIENEPLLRVLGLDKYTGEEAQTATPDGQFDFRPGRTINQLRAEIIFPTLRPFSTGISDYFKAKGAKIDTAEYGFNAVYDTTQTFAQQSINNKYVIRGKATGEASSRYSLGFNVVEGSVQVTLDGRALVQNIDYTVDYILGEVVIKNDRALVPGANLSIKYEQNDLFQLASKTLLGARGDLAISQSTLFGFTIMNLNQQTLSDKVRLGEEPNNNTILGVDGATSVDLPFLTRALDALPLLTTREPSQLKVSGEAAYMIPDPNTQKSTIPSDNGEGIAYIDDFEGSRRPMPVGIAFNAWSMASPPADSLMFPPGTLDTTKMFSKGKMVWFNQLPTDVQVTDVYPNKQVGNNPANNQLTVLDFWYFPDKRGTYNYSTDLLHTLTPQKNWGGVMKPLSVSAINLAKENINYIEVWMKVERTPQDGSGKMLIDLGAISERADPFGPKAAGSDPNSEDLVLSAYPNGTLQEGEDVGIDMRNDAQERAEHANLLAAYPNDQTLQNDPSGDDYYFNNQQFQKRPQDYMSINGTEGNKDGPSGRIPDTEDLNSNGTCDRANSYFEYELNLDTVRSRNPQIVGGGHDGWYQYRIPILKPARTVGNPTQENVEFIRVLFENATDTVAVRIADFGLVGNQWQKVIKNNNVNDSTFAVSVVSVEDNLDYVSPPGVIRERDKTQPDQVVLANEQSLSLVLRGLVDGESGEAARYYTYKALDLFDYRVMKMFIHGDSKFKYVDENNYDAEVYFRFGLDSLNYYEYRAPVHPGWDSQNDVVVNFADVTAIKQSRDSTNKISDPVRVKGGPPGAYYRVLGNPSLTQVVYLAIGVTNPLGKGTSAPLVGEVWANELRLTSVDDSKGWAYRFDTQLKLADLGTVAFNYSRVDPNFHALEQRFGSRQLSTSWALNTNVQLEKFFPQEWTGTSLPFSYSHTESLVKPRYLPNSDVLVTEAASQQSAKVLRNGGTSEDASSQAQELIYESETRRISDTYAAPNFHIGFPSQAWYVRDLVNKLGFGFTYTKSRDRSPALVSHTAWSWNARINYQFTFSPDYYIQPFKKLFEGVWFLDEYKDWKLYYAPSNFNWAVSAVRSRDVSQQRTLGAQQIISRNFTMSRSTGFSWKATEGGLTNLSGDYSLSVESSLLDMELDPFTGRQRAFSAIFSDIFGGGDKLVNFGKDTRYQQRNTFNSKPNIPNIFNIKKYLDFTMSYSVDYGWQNSLTKGDLGKSAGFNNSINFTMNFRLKQLFDPLFEETPGAGGQGQQAPTRGRRGAAPTATDSSKTTDSTSTGKRGLKILDQLKELARTFIKIPLLDYDNISISFTQSNNAQNTGVAGSTGFVNFWGKVPFFGKPDPYDGPSGLYQLGLISDPTGRLSNFRFTGKPPFFRWDVVPGIRAANGVLVNSYRETNRLTFKTSRALWEGARVDLNWNVGWNYSRTQNIQTDDQGRLMRDPLTDQPLGNMASSGNVDRSFLTFPDVLFLGVFKTGLKQVSKLYSEAKSNVADTTSDEEKLAKSFEQGFEAMPFLKKIFGQYYPRVNWSFRWDGLEKLPLFSKFVSRLSLDHAYQANFTRQYQNRPGGGGERTDAEHVGYGFSPLVGLNFTFKELAKGNFGATLRYNTNTSYDLALSARNIVETLSQEMSVTASYSRKGFEIPFFGLALNNDIDISAQYSVTKNSRTTYDVSVLDEDVTGTPLEGTTRTVMEPRIKYVLSSRVTASVYYRYTKIAPDDSGSRIPGTTTNEAGLDIHISIQ